jgi:hypothetical protein
MDDPGQQDDEAARLRRELVLARFYLGRFADPNSFVWTTADKPPHELAREALEEMDAVRATGDPVDLEDGSWFAVGTGRMPRLTGGRAGFVEFHQLLARQALDAGEVGAARAALRVLRTSDFTDDTALAEALLGVLRDSRSPEDEIAAAVRRLTHMVASPARRGSK